MRRLVPLLSLSCLFAGCAGVSAGGVYTVPPEGYEVGFKTADPKLHIRTIAIDGAIACEPTAEGNGQPECSDTYSTKVAPGKHYLQIQVTKPGEAGHNDAEERIAFESDGRYECVISEKFVTVRKTAIDESGFPEPIVECRVAEAGEASASDAAADAPSEGDTPAADAPAEEPPAEATPAQETPAPADDAAAPAEAAPTTPPTP